MKRRRAVLAMALGAVTALSSIGLTGCGGSKASSDNSYSVWIYNGADASYYTEYEDNPVVQYLTKDKTWGDEDKSISFDYWQPAAGTQQDNYQTMIASGDLPDVISGYIAGTPGTMLENGNAIDLTDYIKKDMPNYLAFLEANPTLKKDAVTKIDGEDHYIGILSGCDAVDYYFTGMEYRRDWIVKYGTNPQTGEKFTGGYTDKNDPDSWEDDVVFPSGGTDPVYISDWEWMFDIFTKAQKDLGITESYSVSMYYPGFTWSGGLCSSFGEGVPVWYENSDGQVKFGGTEDSMRAYLECLNNWYDKGWLDQDFYQRTSDAFYEIDDTSVRQGKVGMWQGVESELGGRLDSGDELTKGICVYGCALPINDVYGSDSCKNIEPMSVMASSQGGTFWYVTPTAEDKDIDTLLQFFDYFYSEEGALLHTLGLNKEQAADDSTGIYEEYGLTDGAYTDNGDGTYTVNPVLTKDSGGLAPAVSLAQVPGMQLVKNIDRGWADTYKHSKDTWIQWENKGMFQGSAVTLNMTSDNESTCDTARSKVLDYMQTNAAEFIRGKKDINSDTDWNTWCKSLTKFGIDKISTIYQPYVDEYGYNASAQ